MDISDYASATADKWRSLRQQLKELIQDVSADGDRLKELEKGIAALRSDNATRLSVLEGLFEVASEEQQRATSLTLNVMDDDVVLDKDVPVFEKEPKEPASTVLGEEVAPRRQARLRHKEKSKRSKTPGSEGGKGSEQASLPLEDPPGEDGQNER